VCVCGSILARVRGWLVTIGAVFAVACGGARPAPRVAEAPAPPPPAPVEAPPAPPPPPTYEALVARELGGAPIAREPLTEGAQALHLVLDAGRCYRVVAVAEQRVALELVDEHAHSLASRDGRVVRLSGVCPRWSASFELRAEVEGPRAEVALYVSPRPRAPAAP